MQNDDGDLQSAVPATQNASHLLKTSQEYCTCHTQRLPTHSFRHVSMLRSGSATPVPPETTLDDLSGNLRE